MDIPGFSFVCAFDPIVVGKVLRRYNPGFGQGLKFLEKIIDYPRWLPSPSSEGLISLAIIESKRFSTYVPEEAIRETVPLLPKNPRAVRQFIRLLALLKPQIDRHYEHELNWPIILAANVLKVRHPQIAHDLLKDDDFWETIATTSLMAEGDEEQAQIGKEVDAHINRVTSRLGLNLAIVEKEEVRAALMRLCGQLDRFALRTSRFLVEQMEIAESPHAVTWKEYDEFLKVWGPNPSKNTARDWIQEHADEVERSESRVYMEIFDATISAYAKSLREVDDKFIETDKTPLEKKAEQLYALIECLVFELGVFNKANKKIGLKQIEALTEVTASIIGDTGSFYGRMSQQTQKLLLKLIEHWSGDVDVLMTAIHPFDSFRFTHY